ncbi:EsaB/YukD family protein [Streptomyces sp. HSG2]|uniref:EsaB/YukD family protein n=1 Tax=Streptomyces sp. HSG2 TaxID=2797167 RepID=UPI001908E6D4|nr:EsaB/YukD family protein [Streptomyces sp. HSG2]
MTSAGSVSRTALSRVTLVGERRRVDLVLPSQEPVGLLLPAVMRLLDDRVSARPELRHLVAADGSALAHDSTLESAGVPDGAVLRLVRLEDAPSAPVVHDVTDEVADDLDLRAWRWRPAARRVVAGATTVGWALVTGVLVRGHFDSSHAGSVLLAIAVVSAFVAVLCGRARQHGLAATLIVAGGMLGGLGMWTSADAYVWPISVRLAGVAAVVVLVLLLLGWFSPLGRGALIGAAAAGGCVALWEVTAWQQLGAGTLVELGRTGALLAVVSVVSLGLLPRLAMMTSGLSGLDDRRTGGVSVSRYQVTTALTATHRGLALATVFLAVSAAVAGVLVSRVPSVWAVLLAVVTAMVLALRARAFPLVAEVLALLLASAAVTVQLIMMWLEHGGTTGPLVALGVLTAGPVVVLAVEPAEHVRVRLRRAGDFLESIGVIALFPLVLGVFGVYGRLLDTFA